MLWHHSSLLLSTPASFRHLVLLLLDPCINYKTILLRLMLTVRMGKNRKVRSFKMKMVCIVITKSSPFLLEDKLDYKNDRKQKLFYNSNIIITTFYLLHSKISFVLWFLESSCRQNCNLITLLHDYCSYLLILDRTNWRTNMLTSLLVPYIFFSLPSVIFDFFRWSSLILCSVFSLDHFTWSIFLMNISPSLAESLGSGSLSLVLCWGFSSINVSQVRIQAL